MKFQLRRSRLPQFRLISVSISLTFIFVAQSVPQTAPQNITRPRARDAGIIVGILPTGPLNAITDVDGVLVGHTTIIRGENIRTGVTSILPHGGNIFREKVPAGIFVGKAVSADITVTEYDPPRRFAIRSDQHQEGKKDVWYLNDYTLSPASGGTQVTKHVTSNGNPAIFYLASTPPCERTR